jgi:hypothetical protein
LRGHWTRDIACAASAVPLDDAAAVVVQAMLGGASEFRAKAYVVEGPRGVVGVLAVGRLCFDRWMAAPWLADEEASPLLAEAIDTSAACCAVGPEEVLMPMAPHLKRGRYGIRSVFFFVRQTGLEAFAGRRAGATSLVEGPGGLRLPPPDPRVRLARGPDVPAIIHIVGRRGPDYLPTRWRARRYVARLASAERVLVAEAGSKVVGVIWAEFRAPRFEMWGGLSVLPEAWHHGLSWPLAFEALRQSETSGRTFCATFGVGNTMLSRKRLAKHPDSKPWSIFALKPRVRFRGQRRARALLERVEGARENILSD